jgi:NAD(P)H-dependent FMN reductase
MSTTDPLNIAVIIGSTREGRFGDVVGRRAAGQIEARTDVSVDVIDLVDADLPTRMPATDDEAVSALCRRSMPPTPSWW